MRSETQRLALILDEKGSNNWMSNTDSLRSGSVRSGKEEPFPKAEVSLVLMYAEATLHHSGYNGVYRGMNI